MESTNDGKVEVIDISNEEIGVNDENDSEDDEFFEEEIEIVDEAIAVFNGHSNAVLCCALSNDSQIGVSGGQDDTAFVFNKQMELLFECKGHSDSVISVGFNASNKQIATADMKGLVQMEYDFGEDLLWMLWHPVVDDVILVGMASGSSMLLKTTSGGAASVCGKFFRDGKRAVVGYDDGCVRLWDLRDQKVIVSDTAHKHTITALHINKDETLVATASVDGTAKLFNISAAKTIASFDCSSANDSDESDSVESVCFCDSLPLLATGTTAGSVDIWDISTHKKRNACAVDVGVSKLVYDRNNCHLLYASGLDGVMRIYDSRSGKLEIEKNGHSQEILDFCVAGDSSCLLTASEDHTCRLFALNC
ncbi:angio-associated migratory cell protein-like protein [Leptotrombidium deliense]|uniref:Angio-associated migratory cell protein-like protein n=1 Tax=Leptotrombidium deliense TaxID=299467 RepID=A0A443S4U1_9ACAR|nr:angio-associated migratory cell protein-like protein [Leptotrombidium deliense]